MTGTETETEAETVTETETETVSDVGCVEVPGLWTAETCVPGGRQG